MIRLKPIASHLLKFMRYSGILMPMRLIGTVAFMLFACIAHAEAQPDAPTFTRDILPILQQHCQDCLRPGHCLNLGFLGLFRLEL